MERSDAREPRIPESDASNYDNECVFWEEAVNWIAFENLAGWSFGPHVAYAIEYEDRYEAEYQNAEGRRDLAKDLLIEKATQGKINLFAVFVHDDIGDAERSKVPAEFLRVAEYLEEENRVGFIHRDESCFDLIADFVDLCREFWTEKNASSDQARKVNTPGAPPMAPDLAGRPALARVKSARRRGAGRPREYNWPGFAVEMVRRLKANALPARKSECEAQMLEWCSENWPREPAASMVREWVKAFYDEFIAAPGAADWPVEN